jgi:hypothetical protein
MKVVPKTPLQNLGKPEESTIRNLIVGGTQQDRRIPLLLPPPISENLSDRQPPIWTYQR